MKTAQKGIVQIFPVLIILAIAIILALTAFPSLKDKILNLFRNTSPTVQVTPTPTPTSTSTSTPTATPSSSPSPKPSVTGTPKSTVTPAPLVTSNELPKSGYSSFFVNSDVGTFRIAIGVGDVASTRVVVDTASDSDCANNCPALPLATYVSRRNAYAGINGTYFCPAEYPSCAGKTNSFDFLVMNMNKYYFNSSQNVYSTNPGAIFASGYVRFIGQIQEWGRDTGPDGVISNYPMLVQGGNIAYAGSSDSKITVKTTRSFVANKGNLVYIGAVFSASTEDVAHVLRTLGVDNALNLDSAGSAALWYGGYKVGPGRNIPNAILFISR